MSNFPVNQVIPEPLYGKDIPFEEFGKYKTACQQVGVDWLSSYRDNDNYPYSCFYDFNNKQIYALGDVNLDLGKGLVALIRGWALTCQGPIHHKFGFWVYSLLRIHKQTYPATGFVAGYTGIYLSQLMLTDLMRSTLLDLIDQDSEMGMEEDFIRLKLCQNLDDYQSAYVDDMLGLFRITDCVGLPAREHYLAFKWLGNMMAAYPETEIIKSLNQVLLQKASFTDEASLIKAKQNLANTCFSGEIVDRLDLLERYEWELDSAWVRKFGGSNRYYKTEDDGSVRDMTSQEIQAMQDNVVADVKAAYSQVLETLTSR